MSGARIPGALRAEVAGRAERRCEYCRLPEGAGLWPHEADHIIAIQHGGTTVLENLAFACFHCNRFKGPNVASVDPATGRLVSLFNPRTHRWEDHFRVAGPRRAALTDVGRATAGLLRFNSPERVVVRQALMQAGLWRD
jgi:hypothetical protein